ncbi:MAG: hypothetical protein Solumvirus1_1, partial [Solumvirus sp.]
KMYFPDPLSLLKITKLGSGDLIIGVCIPRISESDAKDTSFAVTQSLNIKRCITNIQQENKVIIYDGIQDIADFLCNINVLITDIEEVYRVAMNNKIPTLLLDHLTQTYQELKKIFRTFFSELNSDDFQDINQSLAVLNDLYIKAFISGKPITCEDITSRVREKDIGHIGPISFFWSALLINKKGLDINIISSLATCDTLWSLTSDVRDVLSDEIKCDLSDKIKTVPLFTLSLDNQIILEDFTDFL